MKMFYNQKVTGKKYEDILSIDDDKINVLVLGTSGCGKSTLINSILKTENAETGIGDSVTKKISVYQNNDLNFRMIDTVGYEYGLLKQLMIKHELSKFCKKGVQSKDVTKLIHMIWFCIDGTTKRIDQEVLSYMKSINNDWKNVPVCVVLTKSYSKIEYSENISMAKIAIEKYNDTHAKKELNVKAIIPVVAKEYPIDKEIFVTPMGIDELVTKTIELSPEAKKISESSIKEIDVKLKNSMAQAIIGGSTLASSVVGAAPIAVTDALILVPIQGFMLNKIADIYHIDDKSGKNRAVDIILKVGTTTVTGKAVLALLKSIPGINIAAAVLNAAVAGVITFVFGQISNTLFQKVYTGEKEYSKIDWEAEVIKLFDEYMPTIIKVIEKFIDDHNGKLDLKDIKELMNNVIKLFNNK